MIIEFAVTNYRSIKDRQVLSMVAESSKMKADNITEHTFANGEKIRLLNSLVIYGANASGKTNILKAMNSLFDLVTDRGNQFEGGNPMKQYEPFLFNVEAATQSTCFELSFLGPNQIKYDYIIEFNQEKILEEELNYYPRNKKNNLFKRTDKRKSGDLIHVGELGADAGKKEIDIFRNQLILSKFKSEANEIMSPIYLYFKGVQYLNVNTELSSENLKSITNDLVFENENYLNKLNQIIKFIDIKIDKVEIKKTKERNSDNFIVDVFFNSFLRKDKEVNAIHKIYDKNNDSGITFSLPMYEESKGTNIAYGMIGVMLSMLDNKKALIIDELDMSLHPKLSKFFVQLFHNKISNPNGAQMIFTTHDTTLLDKDLFRKDQIWFTEKNERGETDLYSAQDFEGVRESTPFEKWYLAGKFGGLPNIADIEYIFQGE